MWKRLTAKVLQPTWFTLPGHTQEVDWDADQCDEQRDQQLLWAIDQGPNNDVGGAREVDKREEQVDLKMSGFNTYNSLCPDLYGPWHVGARPAEHDETGNGREVDESVGEADGPQQHADV